MKMQRVTGVTSKLVFRFVVQKSNYSEMLEFISLGRKYRLIMLILLDWLIADRNIPKIF